MAIAHDAQTRFPAINGVSGTNSVDTTTGDRSFTHDPVGVPKGVVVVLVNPDDASTPVTGITYAGVSLTNRGQADDTSEICRVYVWTLPDDTTCPTNDPATVVLQGCTATPKWVTCSTVTADAPRTKVEDTTFVNTTTAIDALVTLTTTRPTISYGAVGSGLAAPPTTVKTGCTLGFQNDTGTRAQSSVRRTAEDGAGTITLGFTTASDDWCAAGVSLREQSTSPIQQVNIAGGENFTGVTSFSADGPASGDILTGDLILIAYLHDATGRTWTIPSGFTALGASGIQVTDGDGQCLLVGRLAAAAGEAGPYVASIDGAAANGIAVWSVWRGVDQTTPQDVTAVTQDSIASATSAVIGPITPTTAGALALYTFARDPTTGTINPHLWTGAMEVSDFQNGLNGDISQAIEDWVSGAVSGTVDIGVSADTSCGITIALRPAAAVSPIPPRQRWQRQKPTRRLTGAYR